METERRRAVVELVAAYQAPTTSAFRNALTRSESTSGVAAALLDYAPGLLQSAASGVAWYDDAYALKEIQMTGVPSSVVKHYEQCALEIDEVQKVAFSCGVATHNLQLVDESSWLRHPMYKEMGRPSRVIHYMATPIVVDGHIRGAFGMARRAGAPAFTDSDRYRAMSLSMFASTALTRVSLMRSEQYGALERLTNRERTVADLVARGLTNKEIGCQLSVSANTVKAALKTIFTKLDVGSRSRVASLVSCAPPGMIRPRCTR